MPEIEKVLVLSTIHMPESEPDFGELRVSPHDYGYIVYLMCDEERGEGWLQPIVELARKHGCTYINFDRDAGDVEGLQTWEW